MPEASSAPAASAVLPGPGGPPEPGDDDRTRPATLLDWYGGVVTSGILLFVAVGLVGLVAAIAGVARPVVVLPVAALVGAGLLAVWRPDRRPRTGRPVSSWVIVAGVLVIGASTAWNALHMSQHVLTDRDQAIYVNGGKWIAEEGTLELDGRGPDFAGIEEVQVNALGQQVGEGDTDSELEIQAPHLLHTFLGEAEWLGGNRALFVAPALIGALSLAAFFLFALRLVPGPLALVALGGLVVNFVWLYAVRDALSEPLVLLVAFGGAWLLDVAAEDGRWGRLALAGLVMGTGFAARLDAGIAVAVVVTMVGLLAARRAAARHRAVAAGEPPPDGGATGLPMLLVVLAGLAGPALIGYLDTRWHNTFYFRYQTDSFRPLLAFLVAFTLAGLGLATAELVWRWRVAGSSLADRLSVAARRAARLLPALAAGAAALAVVVALFAWFVWPELGVMRVERPPGGKASMESIQVHEGDPADGNRTYAEGAVRRLAWYLGPAAVALGIAGLAVVARRVVSGRARTVELLLVGVAVPATVLYVWRPSIYPDQPWMMRRYLPQVFPGLLLFGALAAEAAGRALARWRPAPPWGRLAPVMVTVLAAVAVIGGPLPVTVPLRDARVQAGHRAGIERLCAVMGPDATAVLDNQVGVGITMLPAVRSFCGIPAARATDGFPGPLPLDELLDRARAEARTLWVVAHTPEQLRVMAPTATDEEYVELWHSPMLSLTISAPPSTFGDKQFGVWVGRVDSAP